MEKYVVAQLEHTSEYICMLDSEFIVLPTPASASSTVLEQPKSHRLGAQSFPPCCQWCTHHTHPTAQEATEAEQVKAELGISFLLKITLQEAATWSFGLRAIPGSTRGHCACALPVQHPSPCSPSQATLLGNVPDLHLTPHQVFSSGMPSYFRSAKSLTYSYLLDSGSLRNYSKSQSQHQGKFLLTEFQERKKLLSLGSVRGKGHRNSIK